MSSANPSDCRVLVVDDAGALARWSSILRSARLAFEACDRGAEALAVLRHGGVDVVVTEAELPDMSGLELGKRVRRLHPDVNTVVASESAEAMAQAERDAFDVLRKPLDGPLARRSILQVCELHRLRAENQRLRQMVGRSPYARRVDELMRRNAELEASNADLDAFGHTAAHALKTPLLTLTGLVSALPGVSPANRADLEQRIQRSAARMSSCIEELMLLSRTRHQQIHRTSLDMSAIVGRALDRVEAERARFGGRIDRPAEWPGALGYAPWVEEVWVNLVSNGLKYGGTAPRLTLGADVDGEEARFWVDDRGPGIGGDALSRLFRPFTRLGGGPSEGYGLGLSIVARVAERLGGRPFASSEPGRGSRFGFTLPRLAEDRSWPPRVASPDARG